MKGRKIDFFNKKTGDLYEEVFAWFVVACRVFGLC